MSKHMTFSGMEISPLTTPKTTRPKILKEWFDANREIMASGMISEALIVVGVASAAAVRFSMATIERIESMLVNGRVGERIFGLNQMGWGV